MERRGRHLIMPIGPVGATRARPAALGLLLALVLTAGSGSARASRPQLIISAAASLTASMQEIKAEFIKEHPGWDVVLNLGGSGALQLQIERGAPSDVFAAAGLHPMNALMAKGLVDTSEVRIFARNQLVVIGPDPIAGSGRPVVGDGSAGADTSAAGGSDASPAASMGFLIDLTRPSVKRIALGNEATVPAGMYAAQVLRRFGMYDKVKAKLIPAEDVRQVLQYVATGAVDAGFVYATDVTPDQPVRVIARIPDRSHDPILCPIAPLKNSEQIERAREFVRFVLGPKGRAILLGHGFLMPPPSGM